MCAVPDSKVVVDIAQVAVAVDVAVEEDNVVDNLVDTALGS